MKKAKQRFVAPWCAEDLRSGIGLCGNPAKYLKITAVVPLGSPVCGYHKAWLERRKDIQPPQFKEIEE